MILFTVMPMLAEESSTARDTIAAVLMVVGIVLIATLLVFHVRTKIALRRQSRPSAREQIELAKSGRGSAANRGGRSGDGRDTASARGTVGRSHRRIDAPEADEIRRFAALIDNKVARLEQLLGEADQRIAALRELSRSGGPRTDPSEAIAGSHKAVGQPPADPPPIAEPVDPLTRSVYSLADEGHSSVEIAQKLDEQIGKIDLILALRRE